MSDQKVLVVPQVVPELVTAEDFAIKQFAATGRTVLVTMKGDAPIVPSPFFDKRSNSRFTIKVADEKEIGKIKARSKEIRKRFQILDSVPYTDIIIGHELPKEKPEVQVV